MKETITNQEKLIRLQAGVRTGGKGTAHRKKLVHRTAMADDKKLQFSLKKLEVNSISGIEEVNMFTNQEQRSTLTNVKFRHPWGEYFRHYGPCWRKAADRNAAQDLKPARCRQSDQLKETGWRSTHTICGQKSNTCYRRGGGWWSSRSWGEFWWSFQGIGLNWVNFSRR